MKEINAILTIASRDFFKYIRDKKRIVISFIFPLIFIGVLGASLNSNLSEEAGYSLLMFTFSGVIGQTMFQSVASGVISLIEDKENDFAQEMFVAPVSRYSILIGKILGETLVAYCQVLLLLGLGLILGILPKLSNLPLLLLFGLLCSFCGGAFGTLVMGKFQSQKTAAQFFPLIIFPQIFLSGVFSPIKDLPIYLKIISRSVPMTYAVDFIRNIFYLGHPDKNKVILYSLKFNLFMLIVFSFFFLTIGTYWFVKGERDR